MQKTLEEAVDDFAERLHGILANIESIVNSPEWETMQRNLINNQYGYEWHEHESFMEWGERLHRDGWFDDPDARAEYQVVLWRHLNPLNWWKWYNQV